MVIELRGHCCSCFLSSLPGKPLRTNQVENACCPPPHSLYIYAYKIMYAAAAKSLQSCPTLCDPIDGSLQGSPIPGIFQARVLEWGTIAPCFLGVLKCVGAILKGEK